ncbi:hypothetical protein LCGC14_2735520 [marine sediment metagenome]|uniref:DUF3846 domain-containing protein n=1 Tax=marine sediment metagenome TaxID=412755 RepID=A0A0F8ZT86_9ZZZZ
MATIIRVDGTEENLEDLSLESLQKAVGGYIEIVQTNDGRLIVLDEEGKLKDKPVNSKATALTRGIVCDWDLTVGDVVIASHRELD